MKKDVINHYQLIAYLERWVANLSAEEYEMIGQFVCGALRNEDVELIICGAPGTGKTLIANVVRAVCPAVVEIGHDRNPALPHVRQRIVTTDRGEGWATVQKKKGAAVLFLGSQQHHRRMPIQFLAPDGELMRVVLFQ